MTLAACPPQHPAAGGSSGATGEGRGPHGGGRAPTLGSSVLAGGGQVHPPPRRHLPAQAGGHLLSRAGVSLSSSQEPEAKPPSPSSSSRPPRRLPGSHRAPRGGPRAAASGPRGRAPGLAGRRRRRQRVPPWHDHPTEGSAFPPPLTQRGRRGHRSGCGARAGGDNGNKYGVGVTRAGPGARRPDPVPTPSRPPAGVRYGRAPRRVDID